jgi:predicted permease
MDMLVQDASQDIAYALRTMQRQPAFAAVAILTLTLGIGANVAIFSVANAVLLRPLKTPGAATLVRFVTTSGAASSSITGAQVFDLWRHQTSVFEDVSAHRLEFVNLTGGTEAEHIPIARVTAEFFRLFRAPLLHGRAFTADEDRPNGRLVAILSHGLWSRRFGADPRIVGQTISLGSVPHVVVGILGPDFDAEQFDPRPDVWVAFQIEPQRIDAGNLFLVTGRLTSGMTLAMANAQLAVVAAEYFRNSGGRSNVQTMWTVQPLQDAMVGDIRSSLNLLLAAVGLLLLIACANVANLLLVRADVRKREMAIRAAIGAGRGRLVRQLLTESVVLSLIGGGLGLIMGTVAIRVLLAAYPETNPFTIGDAALIPRIAADGAAVSVDWRVMTFTCVTSIVTGIVFGLLPGLQAARTDLYVALKRSGMAAVSALGRDKGRAALVVSEIALALMLVVGAALLIRTSLALRAVRPGFESHNVLTMRMSVTATRFETREGLGELTRGGVERIRTLPGVTSASTTCCMPLETVWQLPFVVAGRPASGLTRVRNLAFHGFGGWTFVSPGYFDVFNIPILRGRDFTDRDNAGAPGVVIVNQEMARRFWPTGDPLNDRLIVGRGMRPEYDQDPVRQIVGIVGNVRDTGLTRIPRPAMYVPTAQVPDGVTALNVRLLPIVWVVRTATDPYSLSAPIQKELSRASGGLPVARVRSMDDVVSESIARARFDMWLMTIFGCLALLLAAIGVYSSIAYAVQQRTAEIGIRMALGADSRAVRRMVLGQGMSLAMAGIALGLASAFGLARLLAGFLFGVTARDPAVFIAVPLILSGVALIAVWLPARHATRISPMIALRNE